MIKVKVIRDENVKIVFFCTYLHQKWITLCQTKTINDQWPTVHISSNAFSAAEMLHICDKL